MSEWEQLQDINALRPSLTSEKSAIEGTIVDLRMSKVGNLTAVVYVASKKLEVVDKLATTHGLKFTVREIVPYEDMPCQNSASYTSQLGHHLNGMPLWWRPIYWLGSWYDPTRASGTP